jgi:hypothetical protein
MIDTIRIRLVAAAVVAAAVIGAAPGTAATTRFQPFVTDFPRAAAQLPVQFIPFATDFGISRRAPDGGFTVGATPAPISIGGDGLDWGDVGVGAGLGVGFASLLAAGALAVGRRRSAKLLGAARARAAG